MAENPLSPSNLLRLVEVSIGKVPSSSADVQPQTLRNPYDAIATFVHACMLSVGFRLVGLDEDDKLGLRVSYTPHRLSNYGFKRLTMECYYRCTHRFKGSETATIELELHKLLLFSLCTFTILS